MSDELDLDGLLQRAVSAAATDVLLLPGTSAGKLIIRAAAVNLFSGVVELGLLRDLSMQIGMRTGQPALLGGNSEQTASLGSFDIVVEGDTIRIRVICTSTPNGPMIRLRLQALALLGRALTQFGAGEFGGLEVLPFLHSEAGAILVVGPTASGKTSALHHLLRSTPAGKDVLVVSEAQEIEGRHAPAAQGAGKRRMDSLLELGRSVIALDEMDETDKLPLALRLGTQRLVLATLTSPSLETALRRVGGADAPLTSLIGVLRVGWAAGDAAAAGQLRRPVYEWFALQRWGQGACGACGNALSDAYPCSRCNFSGELRFVPREVLTDMHDPEQYRAGEHIEGTSGPLADDNTRREFLSWLTTPKQS
jgi:hypothetical protein